MSWWRWIGLAFLTSGLWAQLPRPSPTPTPRQIFPISGTVVSAVTGEPLPNTEIAIAPSENRDALQSVASGEDGRFLFPSVRIGQYLLVGARKGFRQQLYEEHEGLSTAIAVGLNANSENLVFRLKPDASISGRVSDDQDDPVENAQVLLMHETVVNGVRCTQVEQGTLSDEDGNYHFGHLAPGKYFLSFLARPWYSLQLFEADAPSRYTPPDLSQFQVQVDDTQEALPENVVIPKTTGERSALDVTYPRMFYPEATDPAKATPILLKPGDRSQADMILTALPTVRIRIKILNQPPPGSVQISVAQTLVNGVERLVPARVSRIDQHYMEVSNLAPGRYTLRIRVASSRNTLEVNKVVDAVSDTQIDAEVGNSTPVITGMIKFSETQLNALDLSQMYVQLRKQETGEVLTAKVSGTGQFFIAPAPPISGHYELVVGTGADSLPATITAAGAVVKGHSLEIKHDWPVGLSVELSSPIGRIDGLALRSKKPVSGAMILLVPQDAEHNLSLFRRGQSNSDGTFSLQNVSIGWYTIVAIENGWDLDWTNPGVVKGYLAGGTDVSVWYNQHPNVTVQVQDRDITKPRPTVVPASATLPTQE